MLKHLTIKNYALIRHLELEPSAHLNVITGETGAGKSIMLGAIGLLMGNRAETKVLWDENEKCITEGVFNIKDYKLKSFFKSEDLDYDDNTVIRREISPGGKSRAFINDTPVTLEVMKRVGSLLMDIHSQHETLLLGNQTFQLKLIDAYAENQTLIEQYAEQWSEYLHAKKAYETLTAEAETLRQEADYIRFQLDELTKANFEENEQESLESEMKIMEHAEEIKTRFQQTLELLTRSEYASRGSLSEARNHLQNVTSYADKYSNLFQRIDSMIIELDDLLDEIEREEESIEFDPERSEFVKERLSVLYRLLKKHRAADVKELLTIQEGLREKDSITSNVDEALAKAKDAYTAADKKVRALAAKISDTRKKTFKPLSNQLVKLLQEVGIPNATLQIDVQETEPTASGIDKIDILFSANKGIAPRPLAQVASGGEFSRLMFCIKYVMAEKTAMPTLILDEIDSGVSGEVAIKLGNLMKSMSKTHQLIAISHLPQVAAKGDAHYFVYKDNSAAKTVSSIRELKKEERVEEIAKMIGGEKPSKVALQNAQELLTA
ncbi:DNA repair protein RecN [Ohtaekwangia sp.]|uniref:DNA repair protein RecN n=1 Tax=Ohtaekwangia sp. TaxID=2066019 RepID=UPI002FDD45C2